MHEWTNEKRGLSKREELPLLYYKQGKRLKPIEEAGKTKAPVA